MDRRPLYPNLDNAPVRIGYTTRHSKDRLPDKSWSQAKEQASKQAAAQNTGRLAKAYTGGFSKQQQAPKVFNFDDKFMPLQAVTNIDSRPASGKSNKKSVQFQQEDILRVLPEALKLSLTQRNGETSMDDGIGVLRNLTSERDNLREQLKTSQALQERAMSERVYLIKRVEDLQATILNLDQERNQIKSKQTVMEDDMLGLEGEVHTLGRKLEATEEKLQKSKEECNSLRQLKTKAENAFIDRHRNLMSIIRELQSIEERKKQLEERNETLSKQISNLTEDAQTLQSTVFQLNQEKDFQRKQLDDKEKVVGNLKLKVQKQEAATETLQQAVRDRDEELETMRRDLNDMAENLDTAAREKEAALQATAQLRDNLDKAYMDHKALKRVVEGSSQDLEAVQRKLHEYINESSRTAKILVSKDKVIERLQLMVEDLGTSTENLQQALDRGEQEIDTLQRKLAEAEEKLDKVTKEKESMQNLNAQLREDHSKAQLNIQALERKMEESNQELDELQGKIRDYMLDVSCLEDQLSYKDKVIDNLQITVEEQEESTTNLQQAVSRREQEMVMMGRNLNEVQESLETVMGEKETLQKSNSQLKDNLDKANLDTQVLQQKVDETSQELQDLQGKLQDSDIDISCLEEQLTYKDKLIGRLEITIDELQTAAENRQQAMNRSERELEAVRRKLSKTEEELTSVIGEKEAVLEETGDIREELEKAKMENQALQIRLDGSNHEREKFHRKLRDFFTECASTKKLLSSKEKAIGRLQATVEELEASTKNLQQVVRARDQELETLRRKLMETEESLDLAVKEKDTMPQVSSFFGDMKVLQDGQTLLRRVDGPNQGPSGLQRSNSASRTDFESWLSASDKPSGRLQFSTDALETSASGVRKMMRKSWDRDLDSLRRTSVSTGSTIGTMDREDKDAFIQYLSGRRMRR